MKITKRVLVSTALFVSATLGLGCTLAPQKDASQMDHDAIRSAVRARLIDYRACYDDALKRDKTAAGKVVVRWTIADGGVVKDAHVQQSASTLKDAKMGDCLVSIINRTLFPEPPKTEVAEVVYPFVFGAPGTQPKAN